MVSTTKTMFMILLIGLCVESASNGIDADSGDFAKHYLAVHNKYRAKAGKKKNGSRMVPDLLWSNELEKFADAFAKHAAGTTCKNTHSRYINDFPLNSAKEGISFDRDSLNSHFNGEGVGENITTRGLHTDKPGKRDIEAVIGDGTGWYGEKDHYNYNKKKNNKDTVFGGLEVYNDWRSGCDKKKCRLSDDEIASVGHFVQVMWSKTTRVGCSQARCNNVDPVTHKNRWNDNVWIFVCNYGPKGLVTGQQPFHRKALGNIYTKKEKKNLTCSHKKRCICEPSLCARKLGDSNTDDDLEISDDMASLYDADHALNLDDNRNLGFDDSFDDGGDDYGDDEEDGGFDDWEEEEEEFADDVKEDVKLDDILNAVNELKDLFRNGGRN